MQIGRIEICLKYPQIGNHILKSGNRTLQGSHFLFMDIVQPDCAFLGFIFHRIDCHARNPFLETRLITADIRLILPFHHFTRCFAGQAKFFLLLTQLILQSCQRQLFLFFIELIIATIKCDLTFLKFTNARQQVQQRPVMTDNQQGRTSAPDHLIQFFPAGNIQMIRRFIHQNNFRCMNKDTGKEHFRLFSSAQRTHRLGQLQMLQIPGSKCGKTTFFHIPVIIQTSKVFRRGVTFKNGMECLYPIVHPQGFRHRQVVELSEMLWNIIRA